MLTRWADGRISLEDPETGRVIELDAFGPTNGEAFAQLLTAGRN
jgi:putative photosynthetic complex assembly protein